MVLRNTLRRNHPTMALENIIFHSAQGVKKGRNIVELKHESHISAEGKLCKNRVETWWSKQKSI